MNNDSEVPDKISKNLQSAIMKALEEEKKSRWGLILKTFLCASILALVILSLLHLIWVDFFSHLNIAVAFLIWGLLVFGFALYFYPQPRLQLEGYWSPWVFAKLLIGMTIITVIQLAICPEFALMGIKSPFSIFEKVTNFYMSFGGMQACMFLCGLTFSFLGAAVAFSVIRKTFMNSRWNSLFSAMGVALLGQLPVIVLQLINEHSRSYFIFWLSGSALALGSVAVFLKFLREKRTAKA